MEFPGDESARRHRLIEKISEAAHCGVDYIQLREKDLPTRGLESLACEATTVVRRSQTRLLINSRVDVAIVCGADGVHLRSADISPKDVRKIWPDAGAIVHEKARPIIASSCHTLDDVERAAFAGADFVAFAPVFEKKGAPDVSSTGLEALQGACRHKIPVFALGGVTVENARLCAEAGVAGVAGIRLFQENDIAKITQALRGVSR